MREDLPCADINVCRLLNGFSSHHRTCTQVRVTKEHWRWKPTDFTERNLHGNSHRFAKTGTTGRIRSDRHNRTCNTGVGEKGLDGRRDIAGRRAIEHCAAGSLSSRIGDDLLNHDHPSVLDHSHNHQEEQRGYERKLYRRSASPV